MKKTLLFIVFVFFLHTVSSSQSLSLSWVNGPISNGDTIKIIGDTSVTATAYVNCKNDSILISVKVRKKELSIIPGSQNYFCWASCYTPSVFVSPTAIDIPHDSVNHNFSGDYKAQGNMGKSYILYTFFDVNDVNDSISVVVLYDCTLSAIGESGFEKIDFSNAYPNPANDRTYFNYSLSGSAIGHSFLFIRDILGNIVIEIPITEENGTLRVFTDKLNNGVYFYSLIIHGKVNFTKKLIIRH